MKIVSKKYEKIFTLPIH